MRKPGYPIRHPPRWHDPSSLFVSRPPPPSRSAHVRWAPQQQEGAQPAPSQKAKSEEAEGTTGALQGVGKVFQDVWKDSGSVLSSKAARVIFLATAFRFCAGLCWAVFGDVVVLVY